MRDRFDMWLTVHADVKPGNPRRYTAEGFGLSAMGKTMEEAKENFIKNLSAVAELFGSRITSVQHGTDGGGYYMGEIEFEAAA